jgi:hypothetical protein
MVDPLAEVIALLRPRAVYSKVISGAGAWAVRYSAFGQPSFCTMLEGECILAVDGQQPITLAAGDFLLMPTTPGLHHVRLCAGAARLPRSQVHARARRRNPPRQA